MSDWMTDYMLTYSVCCNCGRLYPDNTAQPPTIYCPVCEYDWDVGEVNATTDEEFWND